MSQVSRTTSKSKFESGDVPSQQDFIDLHDSVDWYNDNINADRVIDGTTNKVFTATEKTDLAAIKAIIGSGVSDGDSIVDTLAELLTVFQTYSEGVDLATLLGTKLNSSAFTGAAIKALLEALTGSDRLDASAIKNLPTGGGSGLGLELAATFAGISASTTARWVRVAADETQSGLKTMYLHDGTSLEFQYLIP